MRLLYNLFILSLVWSVCGVQYVKILTLTATSVVCLCVSPPPNQQVLDQNIWGKIKPSPKVIQKISQKRGRVFIVGAWWNAILGG